MDAIDVCGLQESERGLKWHRDQRYHSSSVTPVHLRCAGDGIGETNDASSKRVIRQPRSASESVGFEMKILREIDWTSDLCSFCSRLEKKCGPADDGSNIERTGGRRGLRMQLGGSLGPLCCLFVTSTRPGWMMC